MPQLAQVLRGAFLGVPGEPDRRLAARPPGARRREQNKGDAAAVRGPGPGVVRGQAGHDERRVPPLGPRVLEIPGGGLAVGGHVDDDVGGGRLVVHLERRPQAQGDGGRPYGIGGTDGLHRHAVRGGAQRAGGGARAPAQVGGGAQHVASRAVGHPGAPVEGVRDDGDGDARRACDVGDGDASGADGGHGPGAAWRGHAPTLCRETVQNAPGNVRGTRRRGRWYG